MGLGLYLHIPFCVQKCYYCDFPSYAHSEGLYLDYVAALCQEIVRQGGFFSHEEIETVYIGGGTPTVLATKDLVKIIRCIYTHFKLADDVEFSIESNPGTINTEKMLRMRNAGVNRVSIGVQSFSDEILKQAGRIHTAKQAKEAIGCVRKAGIENINIDLMFGLPGQSLLDFKTSLLTAIESGAIHISAYGLKVEDGTVFAKWQEQDNLNLPDEDDEQRMFDLVGELLPYHGFNRYEISNYAKAGYECRHNLHCWNSRSYIGVGVAAHSFIDSKRWSNTADVHHYIQLVQNGSSPMVECEKIDIKTAMSEFSFLALRTTEGIIYREFEQRFGYAFIDCYGAIVKRMLDRNLLENTSNGIRLSRLGIKYGNVVFAEFVQE